MEVRSAIQQVALEQGCPGGARHVNSTAREEAGDQAAVLEGDAEHRNEKEARSYAAPPVGPAMNLIESSLLRAAASLPVANPKLEAGSGSGAQLGFAVSKSFARRPKIVRLPLSPPERWSKTSRR